MNINDVNNYNDVFVNGFFLVDGVFYEKVF